MKTYGRSMGLGFALVFAILAGIGAVAVRGAFLMDQASTRLAEGHRALRDLSALHGAITATETGQRGFLLSGDRGYLPSFEAGVKDTARRLSELRDSPTLHDRALQLDDVERMISSLFGTFRQRIAQREATTLEEVMRAPQVETARRQMAQLRAALKDVEDEATTQLDARSAEMAEATREVKAFAVGGALLGLVLIVVVWAVLQRQLTRSVGGAAEDMLRQSRELEASSQQQASATKETATATVQVTATMHEVQAAAHQIAERSAEVEAIAVASTLAAQAGGSAMVRARETVGLMRQQIDRVVTQMLALGKKVQGATTVLSAVEEFAERTNILAINATIEAASAGEAGERFQVVADEIRRLAERVRGDALEIRYQLDEIRNASNATVMATEAGSKAVDASSDLFAEVDEALRLIVKRVSTSESASQEIRLATQQQSSAVQQLEVALAGVTSATNEAEQSAHRNLSTAGALSTTAHRLRDFVKAPAQLPWPRARAARIAEAALRG
ncbi:hypothetical protein CDN99_13450 [Roseateles aquatilis]|uniref:Methyl-accepting transducer domain-containing protein n=1 Tax=Roseateles aquatilis TaxID=431061 RepID=A0A246JCR2_9BURK|nr:methyl-accepting chemotaxis protein [Roseateles aquatilis]OWQ90361.1 hypothetical protein CDN99_13450 [Roseateles aquatilis]